MESFLRNKLAIALILVVYISWQGYSQTDCIVYDVPSLKSAYINPLNDTILIGLNLLNSKYVWRDLVTTSENENCCTYTNSIKFSGDTIFQSTGYKKVWQSNDSTLTHWRLIGFVREDIKTGLYFKNLFGTQEEQLLYNYNLELNDTVKIPNIFGDQDSSFFIVNNIDNVFIDGNMKKKYLIVYPEYQDFTETWIEGIGSLRGILREGYFCLCNNNTLLCCSKGEELVYKNPDFENCYYSKTKIVGVKEIQSGQFKLVQHFSNQQVLLQFSEKKQRKISVFNIAGAIVETFETFESDEILNISGYKPGLYLVSSTGEISGNQKFIKY